MVVSRSCGQSELEMEADGYVCFGPNAALSARDDQSRKTMEAWAIKI
jgi:hypothetical protein